MPDSPYRRILVVGASSAIAHEAARCFAPSGAAFVLAGRNETRLAQVGEDLRVFGASATHTAVFDAAESDAPQTLVQSAVESLGSIDLCLVAHGELPDQEACERDPARALEVMRVNCLSAIALLGEVANHMESSAGPRCIAVIGSVAGDRGRKSNYVYATSKGALEVFVSGLRGRLDAAGVQVTLIKPGFVDTPMTAALPKSRLFASAREVGRGIYDAVLAGKSVVYLPRFWRWIMLGIRSVPEPLFKKLEL